MFIEIVKVNVNEEIYNFKYAFIGVLYKLDLSSEVTEKIKMADLNDRFFKSYNEAKNFFETVQDCFPVYPQGKFY